MQLYSLQENTPLLLFILTSVNSLLMSNVSQSLVWSLISGHSFHWVGFRVCLPWYLGKSPQYEDAIFLSKTPKKTFYWTLNNETLATNEWCHFDHIHLLLSFYDINIKYDYFCGMACNGKSFIFGLNSQGVCIYIFLPVVQQLCISLKLQSNYKNNTSCKKWKSHKEIWQRTGNQIRCIWDGNVQLLGFFFPQVFSLFRSIWVTRCTFDYQGKENHGFFLLYSDPFIILTMFEKSRMIPRIQWIGDRCSLKTKKDLSTTQSLVLPFFPHPLECNITPFSHFAPPPSQPTTLLPLCGRKKGGFNSVRAWWPVVVW